MKIRVVGSGSSGNAMLVRSGRRAILLDAGVALTRIEAACREERLDPAALDGIFLSHGHSDHAASADKLSGRHRVAVFCSDEAVEGLERDGRRLPRHEPLARRTDLGELRVDTFPVPHDAPNLGFRLEAEGLRIAVVTDIGHASEAVVAQMRGCDVLMIEANHDADWLRDGPYPPWLKERIGSPRGHLSNRQAAELAVAASGQDTRLVVLLHLSERNNRADLARGEVAGALRRAGRAGILVGAATRRGLPGPLEL